MPANPEDFFGAQPILPTQRSALDTPYLDELGRPPVGVSESLAGTFHNALTGAPDVGGAPSPPLPVTVTPQLDLSGISPDAISGVDANGEPVTITNEFDAKAPAAPVAAPFSTLNQPPQPAAPVAPAPSLASSIVSSASAGAASAFTPTETKFNQDLKSGFDAAGNAVSVSRQGALDAAAGAAEANQAGNEAAMRGGLGDLDGDGVPDMEQIAAGQAAIDNEYIKQKSNIDIEHMRKVVALKEATDEKIRSYNQKLEATVEEMARTPIDPNQLWANNGMAMAGMIGAAAADTFFSMKGWNVPSLSRVWDKALENDIAMQNRRLETKQASVEGYKMLVAKAKALGGDEAETQEAVKLLLTQQAMNSSIEKLAPFKAAAAQQDAARMASQQYEILQKRQSELRDTFGKNMTENARIQEAQINQSLERAKMENDSAYRTAMLLMQNLKKGGGSGGSGGSGGGGGGARPPKASGGSDGLLATKQRAMAVFGRNPKEEKDFLELKQRDPLTGRNRIFALVQVHGDGAREKITDNIADYRKVQLSAARVREAIKLVNAEAAAGKIGRDDWAKVTLNKDNKLGITAGANPALLELEQAMQFFTAKPRHDMSGGAVTGTEIAMNWAMFPRGSDAIGSDGKTRVDSKLIENALRISEEDAKAGIVLRSGAIVANPNGSNEQAALHNAVKDYWESGDNPKSQEQYDSEAAARKGQEAPVIAPEDKIGKIAASDSPLALDVNKALAKLGGDSMTAQLSDYGAKGVNYILGLDLSKEDKSSQIAQLVLKRSVAGLPEFDGLDPAEIQKKLKDEKGSANKAAAVIAINQDAIYKHQEAWRYKRVEGQDDTFKTQFDPDQLKTQAATQAELAGAVNGLSLLPPEALKKGIDQLTAGLDKYGLKEKIKDDWDIGETISEMQKLSPGNAEYVAKMKFVTDRLISLLLEEVKKPRAKVDDRSDAQKALDDAGPSQQTAKVKLRLPPEKPKGKGGK
jgi:hypothetical protein